MRRRDGSVGLSGLLAAVVVLAAACGSADAAAPGTSIGAGPGLFPGSTAAPTATPESTSTGPVQPPALSVSKVTLTASVTPNMTAKVTIKTVANAACSITVTYNSGQSTASGPGDKTADSTGHVTWSWKVGGRTAKGSYPIDITCAKGDQTGSLERTFPVT